MLRIVVAEPRKRADFDAPTSETVQSLSRLNGHLELEICHDARSCFELIERRDVALLIVDADLGRDAEAIVARRGLGKPAPTLLVVPEGMDTERLARLREGAADCVFAGPRFRDLLPSAAMAQIQKSQRGPAGARTPAAPYEQDILENLNSALVVLDRSGAITSANGTAERILGGASDGLVGRALWDWFGEPPKDTLIWRTLEEGVHFKGAETRIVHADGRVTPIGISCTPLCGRDGSTLGAVALFQDLSEVKELQSDALQTEKMASIGQLAAGVAHEINNPVGFIHANLCQMSEYLSDLRALWVHVDRLQVAAEKGNPAELQDAREALIAASREADVDFLLPDFSKALLECREGSERIRDIVRDLREFSHRETGEWILADLNQCIDSTANIAWTMMKHCVELEKHYGELPQVRCYPTQIKQVVLNLLVNAYQSIEEQVGSSGALGQICVTSAKRDDGVVIQIRDSGVGISPENLDRIFEPFFTTKQVGSGTGLGLSTCYSIVERHGGTLRATSTPGEGSCFEVWLPEAGPDESGHGD